MLQFFKFPSWNKKFPILNNNSIIISVTQLFLLQEIILKIKCYYSEGFVRMSRKQYDIRLLPNLVSVLQNLGIMFWKSGGNFNTEIPKNNKTKDKVSKCFQLFETKRYWLPFF